MKFFFTLDYKKRYRFFSSEPPKDVQEELSRWKKLWETAKQKIMRLPQRTLVQELAFQKALKIKEKNIQIYYSGDPEEKKIRKKFSHFLNRQKTKHIFLLLGEVILLPVSGLAAFLPGPNVFFYFLALLLITNWLALRGIIRLQRKNYRFTTAPTFKEWEQSLESKGEEDFSQILKKIERIYKLPNVRKILWK